MKYAPQISVGTATNMRNRATLPFGYLWEGFSGRWRTGFRFATLALLIWTAVGVFQVLPDFLDGFHWYNLVAKVIEAWGWALLTPAVLLIDRRLKKARQNAVNLMLIYLPLSIPFSIVHAYLAGLLLYPIPQIWWSPIRDPSFAVYYLVGGLTTFWAFVGILQAINFYVQGIDFCKGLLTSQLELERVERRLIEARLNMLRLQIEPHFLFNALNAISSEVVTNPELVQDIIEDFGALLRRSLDCQGSAEITLAQELALLDHCLAIQRLRFGERIEIRVDAESATLSTMVPSMLLQPLVENAIRHGIEGRMSGGVIAISARVAGGSAADPCTR